MRPFLHLAALGVVLLQLGNVDASHRLFLFRRPIVSACPPIPLAPVAQPPRVVAIPDRNPINLTECNLPTDWEVDGDKRTNIKWSAELGNITFGQPIIADGRVFVTTNNRKPRDPKLTYPSGVLIAFREKDGAFLWQHAHAHPALSDIRCLPSNPTVDGEHLYYIMPAGVVVCAEAETGKVRWKYEMQELGVYVSPGNSWTTPPFQAPLIAGDFVFVVTGNGRDEEIDKLVAPKAPSFVALHKETGKLAWSSNLPGTRIIEGTWSAATYADVNGIPQVIFPGGDGVLYSFEPATGKLLWLCDCLPNHGPRENGSYFMGAPVVVRDKLYVGLGVLTDHFRHLKFSWVLCLDITKRGNVSLRSYDAAAPANQFSALVWAFGGPILPAPKKGRQVYFGSTVSTPAVHDGLLYIPEESGYLHCLDARTGKRYWDHDFRSPVHGSAFWADGKVYVGTLDGEMLVFGHGQTKKLLATNSLDAAILTTPNASNGVLFATTKTHLYAIGPR